MPLNLSDVTLCCYDAVAHEAAALAIGDMMGAVKFGAVKVWSDRPECFGDVPGIIIHPIIGGLAKPLGQAELWETGWRKCRTSHILNVEWDTGINDPSQWTDEFLECDFIGAPWPWHPAASRVGNGGFSLISRRLAERISRGDYPYAFPWDEVLCRRYRPHLEAEGFRWAPEVLAAQFSLEHGPSRLSFGFHDCRNFPRVLALKDLARRHAAANDYVRAHPSWRQMVEGTILA